MKDKAHFPLLTEFARGYLHQDMVPEYGDAESAARAYMADLTTVKRKNLAAESRKMMSTAQEWSAEDVNEQLHRMGAACTFASKREFLELLKVMGRDK